MQANQTTHYAVLGLDHDCSLADIRAAYRLLAKQHHPDVNPDSPEAVRSTQQLNLAHEILSDVALREAYDQELADARKATAKLGAGKLNRDISEEVNLPLEAFLRGTTRAITVHDPGNPSGSETYELIVPPDTAPGARFKLMRDGGGFIKVRVKAMADFRFKVRGSDLRCDLKIKSDRAVQGGTEMLRNLTGSTLRVQIPRGAARGEIIRIPEEGLPKPRGGRGDLLVRIDYKVHVQFSRR